MLAHTIRVRTPMSVRSLAAEVQKMRVRSYSANEMLSSAAASGVSHGCCKSTCAAARSSLPSAKCVSSSPSRLQWSGYEGVRCIWLFYPSGGIVPVYSPLTRFST